MKRQSKKYSRPRKPFDKIRIEEENRIREKYGLKNKKEIWKADAAISRVRNQAKSLITSTKEEKMIFIERLKKKGFMVDNIADVLGLNLENWLDRRLQTIVFKKKLTNTPKQARQFIVHKHITIGEQIVNIPSYQVSLDEERNIVLHVKLDNKEKIKSKIEKIKEEILEGKSENDSEESIEGGKKLNQEIVANG